MNKIEREETRKLIKRIVNLSINKKDLIGDLNRKLVNAKQIQDAQNFTHLFMFALWGIITGIAVLCAPIPTISVILAMSFLLVFGVLVSVIISHQDNSDAYEEIDNSLNNIINTNAIKIDKQKVITYLQDVYVNNSNIIADYILKDSKSTITPLKSIELNDNEKNINNKMYI